MRKSDRKSIWSQCEATPGLAAVMSEWEMLASDDFPGARVYLRPRQQYAGSLPCLRLPPCGCYHEVIDCGSHIEAVCRCEFNVCEPFVVTREDLAVYELDLRRLSSALCEAMGFEPAWTRLEDLHQTYHIGDYYPYEGYRFPVYLTVQHDRCRMERVVYRLCSTGRKPFVFLVSTKLLLGEECEQAISSLGSVCFVLSDIARILPNGGLQTAEYYQSAMRDFHNRAIPAAEGQIAFFPTPPGSTWGSLHISFPDNDHMTCRIGDVVRRFNFAEVGMRDRRNNGRTKQWDLMLEIARNGGVLDRSVGDPKANKKQKQELSEKLRRVFRIEGDPFVYDEMSGCWQILIHLSA